MCTPDDPVYSSDSCACLADWIQVNSCTLHVLCTKTVLGVHAVNLAETWMVTASVQQQWWLYTTVVCAPWHTQQMSSCQWQGSNVVTSKESHSECTLWSMSQAHRHSSQGHEVSACIIFGCLWRLIPIWSGYLCRYFTIPFAMVVLHMPPASASQLRLIIAAYALTNAATVYIFLLRPFRWPDHSIARFIWWPWCNFGDFLFTPAVCNRQFWCFTNSVDVTMLEGEKIVEQDCANAGRHVHSCRLSGRPSHVLKVPWTLEITDSLLITCVVLEIQ